MVLFFRPTPQSLLTPQLGASFGVMAVFRGGGFWGQPPAVARSPTGGLWDQVGSYGHVSRAFLGDLSGRHKKPVLGYAALKNEVRKRHVALHSKKVRRAVLCDTALLL